MVSRCSKSMKNSQKYLLSWHNKQSRLLAYSASLPVSSQYFKIRNTNCLVVSYIWSETTLIHGFHIVYPVYKPSLQSIKILSEYIISLPGLGFSLNTLGSTVIVFQIQVWGNESQHFLKESASPCKNLLQVKALEAFQESSNLPKGKKVMQE